MTLDHINKILFNYNYYILSFIGRLAFPIFCLFIVRNYLYYTSSVSKYALRLLVFGLISQPVVMYAFNYPWYTLNIFFSLLCGLLLLVALDSKDYMLLFLVIVTSYFTEYNYFGLFLTYTFYTVYKRNNIISHLAMLGALILITMPNYTWSSLVIYFVVVVLQEIENYKIVYKQRSKLFKYVFYLYYPTHLLLLELIK